MKKILPLLIIVISCTQSEPRLLTEQEYLKFGKRIENYLKSGQVKRLSKLLNLTQTFDKLEHQVDSLKLKSSVSNAKWKSYRVELNKEFTVYLEALSSLAQKEGTTEISKYFQKEGRPHLILSIYAPKEGMDIIDFELITIGEQTFITDFQSYNTGIQFSESFISNALNKLDYGWLGGEYIDALSELKNAKVYLQREQPERAWVAINRIPEYFLFQSNFQTVKVTIASQLSDSLYVNSLYDWISDNYEQEGFRHLKAYQYYSHFGDTTEAKSYLDSLEFVAGQSFLIDKLKQQVN